MPPKNGRKSKKPILPLAPPSEQKSEGFFSLFSLGQMKPHIPDKSVSIFKEPLRFFHEHIMFLNNSKFFAGVVMILLNVGSKFISIQFSKTTEEYLKFSLSKQLLIFSMAWMGTRDIYTSLVLTAVFVILSDHLFNENSQFCILPQEAIQKVKNLLDTNSDGIVSNEELSSAITILEKAKKEKEWQNRQKMEVANSRPA